VIDVGCWHVSACALASHAQMTITIKYLRAKLTPSVSVTALGCATAAVWALGPVAALVCMFITVSFVFTFN